MEETISKEVEKGIKSFIGTFNDQIKSSMDALQSYNALAEEKLKVSPKTTKSAAKLVKRSSNTRLAKMPSIPNISLGSLSKEDESVNLDNTEATEGNRTARLFKGVYQFETDKFGDLTNRIDKISSDLTTKIQEKDVKMTDIASDMF